MAKLASQRDPRPRSEARIRVATGRRGDITLTVHEVGLAVREHGSAGDEEIVAALRDVEQASRDLEQWVVMLGAQHICDGWQQTCADWIGGVGATLVSAFCCYPDGPERHVALELAAEESSMRILMGIEREGKETVAVLRNLDGNAARAAFELAARIDLADRVLRMRAARDQ